ncbi:LysR family transcriptional regulator [Roseateles cellulosilyticus]|uniref:LysR family transcriptional regulator n=1 Tax=Pelomonas cellulosilytica TaxID=2906762 RepID=A0ABS8XW72_9BURK|nr:LysR family transcriptional regulator [Pelomonas sp. P8]MCE4555468.1 LysR family transcriptional regulator [Pelomonas sp. P8]
MEIYQLKTFVAVATEGNLTRAAERVFTSPPAVSAQLKALEDEFGVRLFDRSARGMTLTPAGERLLAEARRTLSAAQAMQAAAAQIRGEARGQVRMATVSDAVALRLGEVFVHLAEHHPGVQLQLQQQVSLRAIAAVRRGELDCACVLHEHEAIDGLELRRLQAAEIVPVVPRRLLLNGGLPADLAGLAALPWVTTPPDCGLRAHQERLFAQAGMPLDVGLTADTEVAVRGMVAAGMGAGMMRRDQAALLEDAGQARVWPGWSAPTWFCWISSPQALTQPAVAAVRDAVAQTWV